MSNSAISGNVQGLASATSPGLVGTDAQTFAGVKTFNSAPIIGDASGIVAASTTVQGTVSTGAQTLAGKKTFNGGAVIRGETSGTAVTTGFVGEEVTSTQTADSATTSTGNAWIDGSAAGLITLTAGIWIVSYKCCAQLSPVAAGNIAIGNVALYNTAIGGIIENTISGFGTDNLNTNYNFSVSGTIQVRLSASANIYFMLRNRNGNTLDVLRIKGNALSAVLTDPDNKSMITAIRIA